MKKVLTSKPDEIFLIVTTVIFSFLRLPSLIEPYWYGDEGVYEVLGMAINRGRLLYQGIWDNKPPMLYLLYALFDGNQFYLRLLSLLFGVLAVLTFFFVASKLFKSKVGIYFSTLFFAVFFGLPVIEGNIANAENFMLLPNLLCIYLILSAKGKVKNYLFAGIFISLSFLTKTVAVFDLAAIFIFLFIIKFFEDFSLGKIIKEAVISFKKKELFKEYKNEIVFLLAFLAPIVIVVIFFILHGAFSPFYKAVLFSNVGYVGWGNYFLFPMGLLVFKLLGLGLSIILIIIFRKKLQLSGSLIFLWLAFSLFNCLFSQRPYTHYLLVLLPSFSLLLGYLIDNKKVFILSGFITVIAGVIILDKFNLYEKTIPYYGNYINYVLGQKTTLEYNNFFDKNTFIIYSIADYIKLNAKATDGIFVWGDSPQIYALTGKIPPGRYTVAYHITGYPNGVAETFDALSKNNTRYIVVLKDSIPRELLTSYNLTANLGYAKIYEREY